MKLRYRHKKKVSSIIYVNFSPYENTGKILDYFLEKFTLVALFSFSFHRLENKKNANKLHIYKKGKLLEKKDLFDFRYPENLIFLFLPIRSLIIFSQIILYSTYIKIKYNKIDFYFTVNAFTAWTGIILKKIGTVKKTIFWVYDYYPPFHKSKVIAFMRSIYWQFDKLATKSDSVVFLNQKIAQLRKEIGALDQSIKYKIIPIGTSKYHIQKSVKKSDDLKLVFLGVIKKSMGLDLVFDSFNNSRGRFSDISISIIGGGPDLKYFQKKAKRNKLKVTFYGYLPDDKRDEVLQKNDIGLATYRPSKDNVSYFGDPSKIKNYLSYGIPVITTNVFEFSEVIKREQAGIIIRYSKKEIVKAVKNMTKNINFYRRGARNLSRKYYFKKLYPKFFDL